MKKELRRDPNNKIIAGVCSGIAKYLDIDPVIIRLIWAAAIFLFGTGFLFYIICQRPMRLGIDAFWIVERFIKLFRRLLSPTFFQFVG